MPHYHCRLLVLFALRYEAHPVHGYYSWFLYYALVSYLYISAPLLRIQHHPGVRIHSSLIPYSPAHLHPYVRLHPQRYILTDGARPKLKGISHLGRIWVCPFLPRHHHPNLDILLILTRLHDSLYTWSLIIFVR